jgi:hypothetical protein
LGAGAPHQIIEIHRELVRLADVVLELLDVRLRESGATSPAARRAPLICAAFSNMMVRITTS